ncbi:MAG TPA: PA domain-containing protein [Candidatus Eisenbacteria bacterium]|nr:PA domain-containing protein [Candidatus Eisenbacteria bacterium]
MARFRHFLAAAALASAFLLGGAIASRAATIVIVNNDGPGEGFNDPTPSTPFGGNPGTTIGEKRLYIFNYAASIWGGILPSPVTIRVLAQFNAQTCDATSGVLGSAGARSAHANFAGAPLTNTYYHQALANRLSGSDLSVLEDINATFNSDVDNSVCLGDVNWYYGTDGNDGSDIELLPVVLHELAHGLGFSTFTNTSTGAFLDNTPDVFARRLLNKSTGLHWDQMTNNNARKTSAVNTGNLVWDGPSVSMWAPYTLDHEPEVLVLSPATIDGSYVANLADFGGDIDATGITGDIVLVTDTTAPVNDGCEAFTNGAALAGKIALIDRGLCNFTIKVASAQASGAIGVIVANNAAGAPTTMGGTDPTITIPAVMISQADGVTIKNALLSGPVSATLRRSPTRLAGAHADGEVKMYAPNPLEPGSSVSHFDVSALPDLLMEPGINSGLHDGVDLTRRLFEDIGWMPSLTAVASTNPAPRFRVRSVPNPFTPATTIALELPAAGRTKVAVYDVQGRLVKRLLDGWMPAGTHGLAWDGTDEQGRRAAAGVYFSRVESNGHRAGERLVKLER